MKSAIKSLIYFTVAAVSAALEPVVRSAVFAILNIERLANPITHDKQGNVLARPLTHVLTVKGDSAVMKLLGLDKGRIFVPESTLQNFMDKQGMIHEDELKSYLGKGSINCTIEYQETEVGKKYKQGDAEWTAGENAPEGKYKDGDIIRRINKRILGFTAAGEKEYSGNTLAAIQQAKVNRYTAGMKSATQPAAKSEAKAEGEAEKADELNP